MTNNSNYILQITNKPRLTIKNKCVVKIDTS